MNETLNLCLLTALGSLFLILFLFDTWYIGKLNHRIRILEETEMLELTEEMIEQAGA